MLELTYPTCSEKMDIMLITDMETINSKLDSILETRIPALKNLNNNEGIDELKSNINLLKYTRSKILPDIIKKNIRVSTPINIPNKQPIVIPIGFIQMCSLSSRPPSSFILNKFFTIIAIIVPVIFL